MFKHDNEAADVLYEDLYFRINSVIGKRALKKVQLHEPSFLGNEIQYLNACIEAGYVSSVGQFVTEFEEKLAQYAGVEYAILTVNGTTAIQLALIASCIPTDSEVLVPSLTFAATANAVVHAGAVPHFVDISPETLTMCPDSLEDYLHQTCLIKNGSAVNRKTGRIISAILPMHTFGNPADMSKISKIAERFYLKVIEDAAEALGSEYNGQHVCNQCLAGTLSFNGNKIITTGGGGAVLTNDEQVASRAKHLSTTAKLQHGWRFIHDEIGFNYRMPNINAALGLAQLETIDEKIRLKRKLAAGYQKAFEASELISFVKEPVNCRSNYWLNTIIIRDSNKNVQDLIIEKFHEEGVMLRPVWEPLHSLAPYKTYPSAPLKNTENLASKIINLPSSPQLITEECVS